MTATSRRARRDEGPTVATSDDPPVHQATDRRMAEQIRGCTCFRVRRVARRITQIYDRVLAPCGLRVTQFSLLSMLAWKDGMAMSPLADALDMDRTTLTRNLKPLLESGLVSLVRADDDARRREVRLTPQGRTRQIEARRLWRLAQNEVNRTLGEPQIASLHRLFDGLIDRLQLGRQRGRPSRIEPT